MSIQFGDILRHNNPNYPITDVSDIKGGLRSIATFSAAGLLLEYTSGASGTTIPEKYKTGYSLLLERSTNSLYYFSGTIATNSTNWTRIGGSVGGTGSTNSIVKWTGTSTLGNSSMTDDGSTVTLKGNQTFNVPNNNKTSGDIVYFGNVSTGLTPGSIYYYESGDWILANASLPTSSSGLLAIALGTSSSDGMLLRGFSRFDTTPIYMAMGTLGAVQLLSVTDGEFEETQPTGTGEVVRVIGYCVDTCILYFCPDTTWIELS